jgi:hypothetical protein
LQSLYHKYEDAFLSVAIRNGAANGIPPRVMDEVSVEAMLSEAGDQWPRSIPSPQTIFGRSLVISEKK